MLENELGSQRVRADGHCDHGNQFPAIVTKNIQASPAPDALPLRIGWFYTPIASSGFHGLQKHHCPSNGHPIDDEQHGLSESATGQMVQKPPEHPEDAAFHFEARARMGCMRKMADRTDWISVYVPRSSWASSVSVASLAERSGLKRRTAAQRRQIVKSSGFGA